MRRRHNPEAAGVGVAAALEDLTVLEAATQHLAATLVLVSHRLRTAGHRPDTPDVPKIGKGTRDTRAHASD